MARAQQGGAGGPARRLRVLDVVTMIVGIVVGAGIFRTPGLVAAGADDGLGFTGLWLLGGAISLIGALCYAELASAFPHPGGEYHFLTRAFGRNVGFFFAWARLTVIPTGSIALLAFVFGDFAATAIPLGPGGNGLYAAGLIVTLTAFNLLGLRFGTTLQNVFTAALILGLVAMAAAGLTLGEPSPLTTTRAGSSSTLGLAMVFVLLTYGGWNEAAYLSAEIRGGRKNVVFALLLGILTITLLYVLLNLAYLRILGMSALRDSATVGADLMSALAGPAGARWISVFIAVASLTSANATIVMGSRTGFALGREFRIFRRLGRWNGRAGVPVPAMLLQSSIALGLVGLGVMSRRGFETMVEYTAPVFWAFFLLTGIALFALRIREPLTARPFRVPLYPLTPLLFCATCAWLLHASITYTRVGAVVGLVVLLLGAVPLWLEQRRGLLPLRPLKSQSTEEGT